MTKELADFIYSRVYERKGVFIAKEVKIKTGIDIYLSDQRFAKGLGAKLRKAFGGSLVISRTLFSINKNTGKQIYRLTVCYRLDNFK